MAKTVKKNFPEPAATTAEAIPTPKIEAEPENLPPETAPPDDEAAPATEEVRAEPEFDSNGVAKRKIGRPTEAEAKMDKNVLQKLLELQSWEGIWVYVYRQRPFTNKLMAGQKHVHVRKWDTPFDEQDLMEEAGSGCYLIQATKLDPKTGRRPQFMVGDIKILNMNYPPKIPPGEWVDDPKNKEWEWAKQAIFGKPKTEPAEPPQPDPMVQLALQQSANMAKQNQELMEKLLTTMATPKPKEENETLKVVLAILTPIMPVLVSKLMADPKPDPAIGQLLEFLREQAKAARPETTDPLQMLDKQFDLMKKIEEHSPRSDNGARSRKTGWQEVLTDVAEPLSKILGPAFQLMLMNFMRAQQQQQPGAAPQQPPQPVVQMAPPPQPVVPIVQTPPPAPGPQIVRSPIDAVAEKMVELLNRQLSGLDFGDWYIEQFGDDAFTKFRVQGKERIVELLRTASPGLASAIISHIDLDKFLTDVVTWEPADDDDEDDEEEETPAAGVHVANPWNEAAVHQEA